MEPVTLILAQNEIAAGTDGWMMLAPWGRHPQVARGADGRERRYIQVVDAAAAREILANARSFTGKALRFFRALPIFLGHPDAPNSSNRYPDTESKGTIAEIEVREDSGIWVRPALSESGAALINGDTKLGLSPYWSARAIGTEGDAVVVRPTRLISAGLTPRPNLPVDMVNHRSEGDNHNTKTTDMELLQRIIAALAAAGASIPNDANADAAVAAIAQLGQDRITAQTLANERATTGTELATAKARITALESELGGRTTELANERKARVTAILDGATESGRITAADRPVWERRLTADIANESAALAALKPIVPTSGHPGVQGDRKESAGGNPQVQLLAICNEEMRAKSITFDQAWVQSKITHPALHEALAAKRA